MELIAAVYDNWGIGKDGTQPIALKADRKFFRETTKGAMVIVGRRTIEDFPGKQPLPGRVNVMLSRSGTEIPGFRLCRSIEEAMELAKTTDRVMVIGGGSIYRQLLPYCDVAYITKVHCNPDSDTFFPDLDADPQWASPQLLQAGEENEIPYEILRYVRNT